MKLLDEINYIDKQYQMTVNKTFESKSDINDRTIQIADAFGLGLDTNHIFKIYENFKLGFNIGDLIYITGDSGSGKSILIDEIKSKLDTNDYYDYDEIEIDENECLINNVGKDLNDAVKILSLVGLNDAFLFLRKYKELSDGQKRRYKIAKLINLDKKIWFFDEFMATLDRETAKIISFNLQKIARKLNKTIILATTHTDLREDLNPNIYIYKAYNDEIITDYMNIIPKTKCSIINDDFSNLIVSKGIRKDYFALNKYHYKNSKLGAVKGIYNLKLNNRLIGVLVIGCPSVQAKGRNKIFEGFKKCTRDSMRKLNLEFESVDRIIIHPKYRSIGLAYHLLKEYFKLTSCKNIETLAVMANYNPFFEKAGFIRVDVELDDSETKLTDKFQKMGIDMRFISSITYVKEKYLKLNPTDKEEFDEIVKKLIDRYNGIRAFKISINKIDFDNINFCIDFKKCFRKDVVYLYKVNPYYIEAKKTDRLLDWTK